MSEFVQNALTGKVVKNILFSKNKTWCNWGATNSLLNKNNQIVN